jgi:hypothetical protein
MVTLSPADPGIVAAMQDLQNPGFMKLLRHVIEQKTPSLSRGRPQTRPPQFWHFAIDVASNHARVICHAATKNDSRRDQMATHRKSDRRRTYFCAGGLRKRASRYRFIFCSEVSGRIYFRYVSAVKKTAAF